MNLLIGTETNGSLFFIGVEGQKAYNEINRYGWSYKKMTTKEYEALSFNDTAWSDIVDAITNLTDWDSIYRKDDGDVVYFEKHNKDNHLKIKVRYNNGANAMQSQGWGIEIGEVLGAKTVYGFGEKETILRNMRKRLNKLSRFDCMVRELSNDLIVGGRAYIKAIDEGRVAKGTLSKALGVPLV